MRPVAGIYREHVELRKLRRALPLQHREKAMREYGSIVKAATEKR